MSATQTEPSRTQRFVGAIVAFIIFVCALLAVLAALDAGRAGERTVLFVGKAFTYSGFGIILVGWKWPHAVLGPFRRLFASVGSESGGSAFPVQDKISGIQLSQKMHLGSPLQRGLFAAACLGLTPWFFMRLTRELWRSAGASDYLSNVFVKPLSPWFEPGWWWYTRLEWYDWPVLPSLVGLCLAFAWPHTGARLVSWVRGS